MPDKPRVLSGIQPTGNLHIGNYLGAIRHWVTGQNETDSFFCVVDMHAITVPQEPEALRAKTREVAALLLAAGLDTKHCVLFVQSHVSAHAELAWILNCFTPYGWLGRMTQFKEKSGRQREQASTGLFDYPVLMAADILLYQSDQVPVGEDQRQQLELTRDLAQRFNSLFGDTFKLPQARIAEIGARIMGLDDPTKKMSKSEEGANHAINLLDPPDVIRRKVMRATTDSGRSILFDPERPGIYNLCTIYQVFTGKDIAEIEEEWADRGYGDFKAAVADAVIEGLRPLQERYAVYAKDPAQLEAVLAQGAERARHEAEPTLAIVKQRVGLG
jgi:tryptophanyl-tRNA synthetase